MKFNILTFNLSSKSLILAEIVVLFQVIYQLNKPGDISLILSF
jgi:hypothetical protein